MMTKYLESLKNLWVVYFVLGIVAFVLICLYTFSPAANIVFDKDSVRYTYAIQLIAVVLTLFINKRYRRKIQSIKTKTSINEKLISYRQVYKQTLNLSFIIFLCSFAVMFLSNSVEFLIIPIALLLLLFLKRPYLIKLKIELSLSDEDIK